MSVVYLVRHGQASFGQADYDVLSPTGERQAKIVGAELASRGVRPVSVLSGTLSRQKATAEIASAAAGLSVPCVADARWNEYDHLGLVAAFVDPLPTDPRDYQSALDRALHTWVTEGRVAGAAGSFADFAAAGTAALAEVSRAGTALVFTSGGVIAALCAGLLGLGPAGLVALNRVVVNAAITKIVVGRSGSSLVSFNDHGHFEGPNRELLTYR
ncbi:histidine phosphatase family protein [Actinokineospora fastidiosa]|uniref:Fructose 2,6-bisphosphatase n=1 Tax=Actinokineospora fastidiosa TaxID=1816 RepID=A0A918GM38_9PSEU|nr:histidine phosphatase family protein [Actinokineospora fastidiosa]GGS42603.1 fructose 2,6-bisphosphatase [Actinokineospora fastidiosa]